MLTSCCLLRGVATIQYRDRDVNHMYCLRRVLVSFENIGHRPQLISTCGAIICSFKTSFQAILHNLFMFGFFFWGGGVNHLLSC